MEKFKIEETSARRNTRTTISFFTRQKYILLSILIFICTIAVKILAVDINMETGLRELTVQIVALAMLTYSGYWVMMDFGKEKGFISTNYVGAKAYYDKTKEKVAGKRYNARLGEFCKYKRKEITEERRQEYIMDTTVSYEKYLKELKNKDKETLLASGLSKAEIKLIRKADQYKAPHLQASMLWVNKTFEEQFALISKSGKRQMTIHRVKKGIITAIMVVISGSLYASAIAKLDWTIIFQVLCLALNMYFGYRDGFDSFAVVEAERYACKGELLDEAYFYCETNMPILEENVTKMLPNTEKPQDVV